MMIFKDERRTSNIQHRTSNEIILETVSWWKTRAVVTESMRAADIYYPRRFLRAANSKLDVGRSMLDVHCFTEST